VDKLLRRMDDPKIALCGMKLVFPADSTDPARPAGRVQHVGHAVNIRGEIYHPFMGWTADNPKCCVSRPVVSVTGAVFMVRRNAWNQAHGFFEGYGKGYYEDVDLCLTLQKLGYGVFIDAEAIADHYTNATMNEQKDLPPIQNNYQILYQRHGQDFVWTEAGIL
jgi:GT2 family glycosyltransferase